MKKFNYTMNHKAYKGIDFVYRYSFWAIYAVICTCLGTSYTRLAHRLRRKEL